MRVFILVASLVVTACNTDGEDAPLTTSDGGGDLAGCSTSCDCRPGQTCADSACVDGVVPVYCCSSEGRECPGGAICQAPNGEISLCGGGN
jgi:hypothetical protein